MKLKRDYVADYADTIDVVPIGAWYGNGRKAEKGFLSPVLLAVYDEDDGVFRSICRCMSFTDAMYDAMRNFYFDGTPYPDEVGVDDSALKQTNVQDQEVAQSSEDEENGEAKVLEESASGVNCS